MDQRLVLELEGGPSAELPRSGVLTLGSSRARASFVLSGAGVADVHCAIGRIKGGGWALKDLGSRQGTSVNGTPIQSVRLEHGDTIQVGPHRLRVVDPSAPARPAHPVSHPGADRTSLPSLPGYQIQRLLGRGSMGQVFLAVQENLGRPVALKLLAPSLASDAAFVARFLAEARAAAALNHPHVVTVHDVGAAGGYHYLAMEYMGGANLEARLSREARLPWREVLDILRDTARALVYAESRGIVHRDIKPANLMQDEAGHTKLADLGLATHLETEQRERGEGGEEGRIFGTPHFISPEQARGERVDTRSDLYSLGATAYRLLSGRTPFEGDSTRAILRGHFLETPRPLTSLVADLPSELSVLVTRLLEKDPGRRFQSAQELLREIDRIQLVLKTASAGGRRRRWPVAAAMLCALVAAVAFLVRREGLDRPSPRAGPDDPEALASARSPDGGFEQEDGGVLESPRLEELPASVDDDAALKVLELEAELAYRDIPADLSQKERADALRALSARFAGTTIASRSSEEAERIGVALQSSAALEAERQAAYGGVLEELRAAAGRASLENPRAVLLALAAVPGQAEVAGLREFADGRRAIYERVLVDLARKAVESFQAARELAEGGDFDAAAQQLELMHAALELPELPEEISDRAQALTALRSEIDSYLAGLPEQRARMSDQLEREDASTLAWNLDEVATALRNLEPRRAREILARTAESIRTEDLDGWVSALDADLAAAESALEMLMSEFERGGWRRRSIAEPDPRRSRVRDVLSLSSQGLVLDGQAEPMPWSAFGADARFVHQLFHERLERPYRAEEAAGIGALVRLSAVCQSAAIARSALAPSPIIQLDREALLGGFEWARMWVSSPADHACAREQAAVELFSSALALCEQERWATACAEIEKLLAEHGNTLFVRLLSDGSGLIRSAGPFAQRSRPEEPQESLPQTDDDSDQE